LFDQHISNKPIVSKAYSMLRLMQRNFRELSRLLFFFVLYKFGKTTFGIC